VHAGVDAPEGKLRGWLYTSEVVMVMALLFGCWMARSGWQGILVLAALRQRQLPDYTFEMWTLGVPKYQVTRFFPAMPMLEGFRSMERIVGSGELDGGR
jgi:hypothetical protein